MLDPRRPIPLRYPQSNKLLLVAELELDDGTYKVPIYSNTNLDKVARNFVSDHELNKDAIKIILNALKRALRGSIVS
jgi:hypothetical protein